MIFKITKNLVKLSIRVKKIHIINNKNNNIRKKVIINYYYSR